MSEKETNDKLLEEARERYQLCIDADSDNREKALADLRFLSGDQWDDKDKARRNIEGRPCLTINKLPTFLHQVTNDQRQNKPGIKIHPVDDDADIETAEVLQGIIRHIEYGSNADVAYDTAVNSAAAIGVGYFRLTTDYCNPESFDQDIKYKRIRNALSVKIDPLSQEPDGSDMQFCFVESLMPRDEFEREYPDAEACNYSLFQSNQQYLAWMTDKTVLVCEYYRIEKTKSTLVLLSNGVTAYKDELPKKMPRGVKIEQERESFKKKVMWYKITGVDVLEKTEIKCDWIPVFPVYGDELDIEGKVIRSGLVRYAKDPAQMYNYWMTAATEEVAMRNKTPYIGAEGQFEGYESDWNEANVTNFSYLQYKPVTLDGQLAPPPMRQPMADVPTGVLAMAMHASDNIKATTGLFDSSLGNRGSATSGKQEIAQQRQGDVANFHYSDNLNRTVRHCGRCIISMIPNYYDSERVVKIMGEDEKESFAYINKPIPPQEQKPDDKGAIKTILNDMTVGTYDVTVSAGPSYDTLRQEAVDGMIQVGQAWPKLWEVAGDKLVAAMDWPGAEEISERLKKAMPPELVEEADEDEQMIQTPKGPIPVSQAGQAIAMMDQQLTMAEQAIQQAEVDKIEIQKQELELKRAEIDVKQFEAKTDRMTAEADLARAQAEAAMAQESVDSAVQKAIQEFLDSPAEQVAPLLQS